jgi:hypothetical protein
MPSNSADTADVGIEEVRMAAVTMMVDELLFPVK